MNSKYLVLLATLVASSFPFAQDTEFGKYALFEKTAKRPEAAEPVETKLPLKLDKGIRIGLVGNTLFDRMHQFGHLEALLQQAHPGKELVVRNLSWAADEVDLQPRPANFANAEQHLTAMEADVVLAAFGYNESFAGKEGLLAAVAEEGFRALENKMRAASKETRGLALAEFRAIGFAYIHFAANNPSHFRVMFGPEVSDKSEHSSLKKAADRASQIIANSIANCQRPGLEGGDTDPQRLFISAWSTFHGLATLIVDGQLKGSIGSDAELEALGNSVTDVIYRGLSFSGL